MYLYSKVAAQRIWEYNPEAKILIFLREHKNFLKSYHQQLCLNLDEDQVDIGRAFDLEAQRRDGRSIPKKCREPSFLYYTDIVQFSKQVSRYLSCFPASQVRVLRLENWSMNTQETWEEVCRFLNLPADVNVEFGRINEAKYAVSTVLSGVYRSPPHWLLQGVRPLKKLGINTKKLAGFVRSLNERPLQKANKEAELISGELLNLIVEDERRLETLIAPVRIGK